MTPENPPDEESVFTAALALPLAERSAFLDRACVEQAKLRARVESLLRAHDAASSFLATAMKPVPAPTPGGGSPEEQPGDWIARYKLLQQIGEGGCGIVYMAEQEDPVRRRVALKVIKLGMDTKAVIARFEAERQALAMMDHPSIAKVYDAGATDTGRPYFVMELVRGTPVTRYCDDCGLVTEQRLQLFMQVCQAIQHAHQKGIIHRDIKPSNILVTLHDGVPVPKVIDFGIAKATQGRLTDHTFFTAFDQFIGTPAYMSPEQAELSGLDVDTRSDVYSLGVLLYEMLTGRTPLDPKSLIEVGIDEMRRMIREEDPPRPSTRLSTLTDLDGATVAKRQGMAPAELSLKLAGDLDWIVMRCLEKDRTRRYATPSELVTDLQRYLHDEPVIARPPSTSYLLQKLVRRHRVGVFAGTAVAVSLIAGLVVSSALLVRERAARERAVAAEATESRLRREAEQAGTREAALRREADTSANLARVASAKNTQVARFMTDMLSGVGPEVALGRDTTLLRQIVDATTRRLDTELRDQPAVAADLRDTLGSVYVDLGAAKTAEPLLRAAVAAHRELYGNDSPEAAASLHLWGRALRLLNRTNEANAALDEALAIRRKSFGPGHPLVADTLCESARLVLNREDNSAMRALVTEALDIRRKAYGPEHREVAEAIFLLARTAQSELRHQEALPLHEEALAMRRRLLGNDHPEIAESLDRLGFSYAHELDRQGDAAAAYGEAFQLRRRLLGDAHPETVSSLVAFVGPGSTRDTHAGSLPLVREYVASLRKLLPPGSPLLAPALLALASLENAPHRHPMEAEALVQEARTILEEARGNDTPVHPDLVTSMGNFAWFKFMSGVPAEGLIMGEEGAKLVRQQSGGTGRRAAIANHIMGWVYFGLGRPAEAAREFEKAVPLNQLSPKRSISIRLVDVAALGACYRATNRLEEAERLLAVELDALEADQNPPGPTLHIPMVMGELGLTRLAAGRFAEAETLLRRAVAEYDQPRFNPLGRRLYPQGRLVSGLGQALARQRKFAEAEPLVLEAYRDLHANQRRFPGNAAAMVHEAHAAVIALYTAWEKPAQATAWQAKADLPADGEP